MITSGPNKEAGNIPKKLMGLCRDLNDKPLISNDKWDRWEREEHRAKNENIRVSKLYYYQESKCPNRAKDSKGNFILNILVGHHCLSPYISQSQATTLSIQSGQPSALPKILHTGRFPPSLLSLVLLCRPLYAKVIHPGIKSAFLLLQQLLLGYPLPM